MARYSVFYPQEIVVGSGRRWMGPGKTVADSAGVALAGDIVSAGLVPNRGLVALDASAVTAFAGQGITAVIGQQLLSAVGGPSDI
jgi:hypothetical protein